MPFELSWIPGGSVGFLIDLFRIFELTMVVVKGRGSTMRNAFFIALVSFLLLLMALDFGSLLGLLPRPRCCF